MTGSRRKRHLLGVLASVSLGIFFIALAGAARPPSPPAGGRRLYLPLVMRKHRPVGVWVVNRSADVDDGACSAAHCTLREAINAANLHAGPQIAGAARRPAN